MMSNRLIEFGSCKIAERNNETLPKSGIKRMLRILERNALVRVNLFM
jgi:hypothetical protein